MRQDPVTFLGGLQGNLAQARVRKLLDPADRAGGGLLLRAGRPQAQHLHRPAILYGNRAPEGMAKLLRDREAVVPTASPGLVAVLVYKAAANQGTKNRFDFVVGDLLSVPSRADLRQGALVAFTPQQRNEKRAVSSAQPLKTLAHGILVAHAFK